MNHLQDPEQGEEEQPNEDEEQYQEEEEYAEEYGDEGCYCGIENCYGDHPKNWA